MPVETFIKGFHDDKAVDDMEYEKLGSTDMNVSKLSFGGAAFSGFYGEFEEAEGIETIRQGLKQGINYIDTAPFYGGGRSETLIGKALKGIDRKAYYLSTKVGRYGGMGGWKNMFDFSAQRITKELDKSLQLLGVSYVDIIVVHDVEFGDKNQLLTETLPAARKLIESGKGRYLAISGYPLSVLWEILQESTVQIDVVLTYSRYTLIDNTLEDYVLQFLSKRVGIINAAPTACGMLVNSGPHSWHPANEKIKSLCAEAAKYCQEQGVELGRLAVYYALKNPHTPTVLVGMNNLQLLKSNLELVTRKFTDKEHQVLTHLCTTHFNGKLRLHWEGVELAEYKKTLTN